MGAAKPVMVIPSPPTASIQAILLDIEGTTTPLDFVYEVLFPFARARVRDYLRENLRAAEVASDIAALRREHEADIAQALAPPPWPGDIPRPSSPDRAPFRRWPGGAGMLPPPDETSTGARPGSAPAQRAADHGPDPVCSEAPGLATGRPEATNIPAEHSGTGGASDRVDSGVDELPVTDGGALDPVVAYVHWLMDQDRKSPGLKALQGKIWRRGYEDGSIKGRVFADVPPTLARWRAGGTAVAIFSSGSVLAQKLLFAHSETGDLTPYLQSYFDTSVGPKTVSASYARIAGDVGLPAAQILFVSDVVAELDAARSAGMQTRLCVRPGNRPQPVAGHAIIHSLAEIAL